MYDLEVLKPLNFSARPVIKFLILGPFGPVRPAGLDFQARPGPRAARPVAISSMITDYCD